MLVIEAEASTSSTTCLRGLRLLQGQLPDMYHGLRGSVGTHLWAPTLTACAPGMQRLAPSQNPLQPERAACAGQPRLQRMHGLPKIWSAALQWLAAELAKKTIRCLSLLQSRSDVQSKRTRGHVLQNLARAPWPKRCCDQLWQSSSQPVNGLSLARAALRTHAWG
eukprot:167128-Chlamydomonas_euryale.AAC.5